MGRRNREDYLTRNRRSPNWYLNFRVPETHKHLSDFFEKDTYQISTNTSDYTEACRYRDAFFTIYKLFGYGDETPNPDAYWRYFSGSISLDDIELYDDVVSIDDFCAHLESQDKPIPEPYLSVIQGHRNRQLVKANPLAEIQHPFPLTLSSLHESYKKYRDSDLSDASHIKLAAAVRELQKHIGNEVMNVSSITKHQVFGFVQSLEKQGYSASTIRNHLSFLGRIYNFAQLQGLIPDERGNPFKDQPVRSKQKIVERKAMPIEHARILFKLAPDSDLKALIAFGHYAGLRLSEAFTTKITKVGKQVTLEVAEDGGKTKSASRQIPAHDHLWEIIQELQLFDEERRQLVWKSSNASSLGKRFGRLKTRYFEKASIDHGPYVFHSFRHAFSTYLVNSFDELKASELTGHDKGASSATELGRTYYKGLDWNEKKEMIESLPKL